MKTRFLCFLCLLVLVCGFSPGAEADDVTVACYYFPNYYPTDAQNAARFRAGWSEWELVKAARPRFEGHRQPNVPAWGYTDESDPAEMARKIDAVIRDVFGSSEAREKDD